MTKNIILSLFLSLVCLVACTPELDFSPMQLEQKQGATGTLRAIIGETATKTSFSQNNDLYHILWSEEDKIGVFVDGQSSPAEYLLKTGAGTKEATFEGVGAGKNYVALYPYDMCGELKNGYLSFPLPAVQHYTLRYSGANSYPMLGTGTNGELSFRNLCAVLKLSLKGRSKVNQIVFTAHHPEIRVSGQARVAASPSSNPALEMLDKGSASVTLEAQVMLNPEVATDFYLVLPPQSYPGGFSIEIKTPTGSMKRSTDSDIVMNRSELRGVPVMTVVPEDGLEPSDGLSGSGQELDPFLIGTVEDLLLFSAAVNSEQKMIRTKSGKSLPCNESQVHYLLTADLDLSTACGETRGSWEPIGCMSAGGFSAIFDGGGHTISHLYIDGIDEKKLGLFGYAAGGQIQNLAVEGSVRGREECGIVIGKADLGTILRNVSSAGSLYTVMGAAGGIAGSAPEVIIDRCRNAAAVSSDGESTGGIVGNARGGSGCIIDGSGWIVNCSNTGPVQSSLKYCGGIAGTCQITAANCLNLGAVRCNGGGGGGIAGRNFGGRISNCLNLGEVTGEGDWQAFLYTGSLLGFSVQSSSIHSLTEHNFWLYDPGTGKGMIPGIGGPELVNEINHPLTENQFARKAGSVETLYESLSKDDFHYITEALNAFAFDHSGAMGLAAWTMGEEGHPILTDKEATYPSPDYEKVFVLSQEDITLNGEAGTAELIVLSGDGCRVENENSWLRVTLEGTEQAGQLTRYRYLLHIDENPQAVARTAWVPFCTSDKCLSLQVIQSERLQEDNQWKYRNFYHTALAFRFTTNIFHWETSYEMAMEDLPGRLECAEFHYDMSDFAFSGTKPLSIYYGGTTEEGTTDLSDPYVIIDGRASAFMASDMVQLVYEAERYGTSSGITFSSSMNGNDVSADIMLYIKKAGDYKVTALLLEDQITARKMQVDGTWNNDFIHSNIVRACLNGDVLGEAFSTADDNSIVKMHYAGKLDPTWNPDQLRLLVFVQRRYGVDRYFTVPNGGYYNANAEFYLDNSRTAKLGSTVGLIYDDDGMQSHYSSSDYSMDGKVTQLRKSSVGSGIDIVIVGDAFSDRNQSRFDTYAREADKAFFDVEPYGSLADRFNVYAVNAVSENDIFFEGRHTRFSSILAPGSETHIEGDNEAIWEFVHRALPQLDLTRTQVIVLVNSSKYAGTCYMYNGFQSLCYVTLCGSLSEFDATLRHEAAGHGFGKLNDEYTKYHASDEILNDLRQQFVDPLYAGWNANVDVEPSPSLIRWAHLIADGRYAGNVGVFEGAATYINGVYRPSEHSIMRFNYGYFNAPSREGIYKRVMQLSEGSSWQYDYETFARFDELGRKQFKEYYDTYYKTKAGALDWEKDFIPLAPPVVVKEKHP